MDSLNNQFAEAVVPLQSWFEDGGAVDLAADGVIAATLLLMPVLLFLLYGRRTLATREAAPLKLFLCFAFAAGLHYAAIAFGSGFSTLEGVLKGVATLLAVLTLIGVVRILPLLFGGGLRDRLQMEVAADLKRLKELNAARQSLEVRMEESNRALAETKQRFEIALRGSPISVFSQDPALRFTWAHNLPDGLSTEDVIGKTDADILEPEVADVVMAAKHTAMESGSSQDLEIDIKLGPRERTFYLVIEPVHDETGKVVGTASVAVDISDRKASEQQLRGLLRELTHRSKNLLTVIHAIARQTAARTTTVDEFLERFGARLYAIGMSHDLLVADDWQGASLRMLVEQQLEPHMKGSERIDIEGEDVVLKPEAVHNLGLALHELTANAEKFGSLSNTEGAIRVRWNYCEDAETLNLKWEESGGPAVQAPSHSGFGRTMIETVVSKALAGDVTLSFPAGGVTCEIVIPAAHITSRG